jgi:hypothetical protein
MKNVVVWDIRNQFVPHRRHITSPLQSPAGDYEECRLLGCYAVWLLQEPTIRRSYRLHHQGNKNWRSRNNVSSNYQPKHTAKKYYVYYVFLRSLLHLIVIDNAIPSSLSRFTLMMGALGSSETLVLIRATRRNITEDGILHSHRRKNLKSYIALTGWTL